MVTLGKYVYPRPLSSIWISINGAGHLHYTKGMCLSDRRYFEELQKSLPGRVIHDSVPGHSDLELYQRLMSHDDSFSSNAVRVCWKW